MFDLMMNCWYLQPKKTSIWVNLVGKTESNITFPKLNHKTTGSGSSGVRLVVVRVAVGRKNAKGVTVESRPFLFRPKAGGKFN